MKRFGMIVALWWMAGALHAQTIDIPWTEFKTLFRESIERRLKLEAPEPVAPAVCSLDRVRYELRMTDGRASGEASFAGQTGAGRPVPVPLLGADWLLAETVACEGGFLQRQPTGGVALVPSGPGPFAVQVKIAMAMGEDAVSQYVEWEMPAALVRQLKLDLPAGWQVLDAPGLPDDAGVRHLPLTERVRLRVAAAPAATAGQAVPEVDLLSRLRFEDTEVAITAWLYRRRGPETVLLELPAAARLAGSSLPGSRVTPLGEGVYRLELARLADPLVRLDVVLPVAAGEVSIPLPRLRDNRGRQGYFVLDRPAGVRVEQAAGDGVGRLPVEQLPPVLAAAVAGEREVFRQAGGQPLRLTLEPYEPVAAPAAVLDSIVCHAAFEENGGSMTVLELQLEPGGPGAVRLQIPPDASLWYVRLDGDRCQAYRDTAEGWIVPVDPRRAAKIEVAFIRRQEPLGLHGRLEVLLPATGLPCRRLCLAVAIPERLQVTSIEGPVTPGAAPSGKAPAEFIGKPHYFSRAFYPGDGLRVALAYAEPATPQPE